MMIALLLLQESW